MPKCKICNINTSYENLIFIGGVIESNSRYAPKVYLDHDSAFDNACQREECQKLLEQYLWEEYSDNCYCGSFI